MAQSVKGADQAFALRAEIDAPAKRAIALVTMKMLLPNQTVLMNDGTTIFALALEMVPTDRPLTVVTAGVNIATCLSERTSITAYLLGGRVWHLSLSTSGGFAEKMLQQFNADMAIISVDGISIAEGVTFSYEADAGLARLMAKKAARTVVLATTRKLQNVDRITACPLSSIQTLITDCVDRAILNHFSAEGVEVISVPIKIENEI